MRLIALPVVRFLFGLTVKNAAALPAAGPAIVAPNHNSHLDILLLMAAVPPATLRRVRPVGAADTFASGRSFPARLARFLGVIPLDRAPTRESAANALVSLQAALQRGEILIVFPEGTRGEPETPGAYKTGLARLAIETGAPVCPVHIQGAGRSLPRRARIPVPFTCTILCGPPIAPAGLDRVTLMARYRAAMDELAAAAPPLHWI